MSRKINQIGKVTFKQSISDFWAGYFDFKGRTTRLGYFWIQIFYLLLFVLYYMIIHLLGAITHQPMLRLMLLRLSSNLLILFSIFSVIPNISIVTRRLRDAGFSNIVITILIIGYYFLLKKNLLLSIIMLILLFLPSKNTQKIDI